MNEEDNGYIKNQEKEKQRQQNILEYQRKFFNNKINKKNKRRFLKWKN